jgi:hypothetical protein
MVVSITRLLNSEWLVAVVLIGAIAGSLPDGRLGLPELGRVGRARALQSTGETVQRQ